MSEDMNVLFLDQKRKDKKKVGFVMNIPTVPRVGEELALGTNAHGTVQTVIWQFRCNGSKVDAIVVFM